MNYDLPVNIPASRLLEAQVFMENREYLNNLQTSNPVRPGMYLSLLHGREDKHQRMDGWGSDGPMFGPLDWVHITYLTTINVCGEGDDDGTGPMLSNGDPMYFDEEMIFYDGVYYGDWELVYHKGGEANGC